MDGLTARRPFGDMRWISGAVLALTCGCIPAPPAPTPSPWSVVPIQAKGADKVDLLFAIDNSHSMILKQPMVTSAAPTLVRLLLDPNCVDPQTAQVVPGDGQGCATLPGTKPEWLPVHDLHVAVVSSSLGGGGSPDVCSGTDPHDDDGGHLLNRTTSAPGSVANANPLDGNGGSFLAWLPASDPANASAPQPNVTPYADGNAQAFVSDFQALVQGAQGDGCDLEGQLESWYRFLIQPDPYDQIPIESGNSAVTPIGVDTTLLKMRHDFLRPDSLVAIMQVTDEEDSWSDPMWEGGYGWVARTLNFPGAPGGSLGVGPRGTSECDAPIDVNNVSTTGPNNPDCVSCAFSANDKPVSKKPIANDPNCNSCFSGTYCPQKGWYSQAEDGLSLRYANQTMRARYGFDNQYNVQRYIDGLRLPMVPDRDHETHDYELYASTVRNCINPLFARDLPDGSDTSEGALCNLALGSRTPDQVYYGLIAGIAPPLVRPTLTSDDWIRILGKDPEHYIFDGIDPHMLQSSAPRPGLGLPSSSQYTLGNDPVNGREYNAHAAANGLDFQYACTFDLPKPIDCAASPESVSGCDCTAATSTAPDAPPLCDPTVRTKQIKGKVYPTIRELRVAKGLGIQASVASLCATDLAPAMDAFVHRVATSFNPRCMPAPPPTDASGNPSCVMLAVFADETDQATACSAIGLSQPTSQVLLAAQGASPTPPVACVVDEAIDVTGCATRSTPSWCYLTENEGCPQRIETSALPAGAELVLVCASSD